MDEWSRLPNVLVQQVLSLVSMPELCRFRTVCKRWNSLICMPEFGNLCAQNADEDHARYVIGRCFHFHVDERISSTFITVVGWSIYDLNERRWFTWKGEQDIAFANDHPMASDRGLVVCCSTVDCTTLMVSEMIISNPIAKTRKVLPIPPCGDYYTNTFLVKLVVDSISQTYKIFLINRFQDPFMCVFDSTTNQWRSLNNTPVEMKGRGIGPRLGHSVMFQGLLYVLSSTYRHDPTEPRPNEEHPFRFRLHSYNFLKDSWADCGVDFPATWADNGVLRKELVVSGNRLFVVSGYTLVLEESDGFIKLEDPLSVIEILLADKTLNTVSHLAEPLFHAQGLEVDRRLLEYDLGPWAKSFEFNQAFGFGNSIMLTYRWLGFSIVYNVVTCLWELIPTDQTVFFYGNVMPLRLPSAGLW